MIHVSVSVEYKGFPFTIEIDTQKPDGFDLEDLGLILDKLKMFIDDMLANQPK